MSRIRVAPIVEGHGEVEAVPILLRRAWTDLLGGEHVHVLHPLRRPRSKLIQEDDLRRAVDFSVRKLAEDRSPQERDLVLLLLDGNGDPVCRLGPKLLETMRRARRDADVCCVLANVEFETWFVAAAESLGDYLEIATPLPLEPERDRCGKRWVGERIRRPSYSETVDQPAMTAVMDLALCRSRSASFDKLCRELLKRKP